MNPKKSEEHAPKDVQGSITTGEGYLDHIIK